MRENPRIALLACEVFLDELRMVRREIDTVAVERQFEIGLHDRPDQMRVALQQGLDELAHPGSTRSRIIGVLLASGRQERGSKR